MGINSSDLLYFIHVKKSGVIAGKWSVAEIGEQQLSNDFLKHTDWVAEFVGLFGNDASIHLPPPLPSAGTDYGNELLSIQAPYARQFWQSLGCDYIAIDTFGTGDSVSLDLNFDDVPQELIGKFSLVTNHGTTEHVANQVNAFKIAHDLTAVGGVMYHHVPAGGMMNHGLFNYNPKFFWMLARSNGYKFICMDYKSANCPHALPDNVLAHIAPSSETQARARLETYNIVDASLIVLLQKTFDTPYVPPLDVQTGTSTDNEVLRERYWSVFYPDPFLNPPACAQALIRG